MVLGHHDQGHDLRSLGGESDGEDLGAGRAATFPAVVPCFSMIIGYLALGVVPSLAQVIGLVIVVIGFRFALR